MSKVKCYNCDEVFDEDEILLGTPNMVPYGDTQIPESYDTKCPYCRKEGHIGEYEGHLEALDDDM